jgi:hypothetical protein
MFNNRMEINLQIRKLDGIACKRIAAVAKT